MLPLVVVWLSSNYSLDYVFYFFAALSGAALLIILPVKEIEREKEEK